MSNIVLQVSSEEILKMKKNYHQHLLPKLPPGSVFSAKVPNCTITAYKSGKVLFQGGGSDIEARKWQNGNIPTPIKKAAKSKGSILPENISSLSIIGSDEVGTGDYFGPITVVAAFAKADQIPLLKELGVKDSKNLTDPKIVEIAKQLITFLPYSLLTLHNEKYNEMQQKGMSQGKMKALLHNQAITNLLKKLSPHQPDAILIDQFAEKEIYYRHLSGQKIIQKENVFFQTKAESIHVAVAAASIIARYAFLQHFEKLSQKAGFQIPKGAGHQVDLAAARLIRKHGVQSLNFYTKQHFANTEKAKKLI